MNFRMTKTIFLTMKLTAVLLFSFCLQVSATGFAQRIHLSFRNAPLKSVFKEIEKQTGMTFYYNEELLGQYKNLNIQIRDASLEQALDICVNRQQLQYSIVGNTIVIQPAGPSFVEKRRTEELRLKGEFLVTGSVFEETSATGLTVPLVGATVFNKNSNKNTATDNAGRFSILAKEKDVLVISFIGHEDKSLTVSRSNPDPMATTAIGEGLVLSVYLKRVSRSLDETVVIGYGSVKKKDITGSVSVIGIKDVQDVPFTTIDNAIAGKAAGVQVTKSDGTPGGAVRIRVRGSTSLLGGNDPLYVIDGVPVQVQNNYISPGFDVSSPVGNDVTGQGGVSAGMSTAFVNGQNTVAGLNIDDIESITILKDASSTAIYGSKAANGVVIINTKKGRKDMKPQIQLSYYGTYSQPINPTLLNAAQYKTLLSEAAKNDFDYRTAFGLSLSPELKAIVNTPDTYFGKANTNWLDLVTRDTYSNNVELSVQGGGSATKYYTSLSYNNTPGVINGSDFKRISGQMNIQSDIGSRFKLITNLNLGAVNQDITNGAYGQALRARPDYAPYDSTGNFTDFKDVGESYQGFQNPIAQLTATNNSKRFSLLGSVSGLYDLSSSLQFKSTVSLNMQNYDQRNYTPSYLSIGSFYGNVANNGGIGANANSKLTNWFVENTLTYTRTFNTKHSLTVLAGTSYETRKLSFFSATASGYPNNNVLNSLSSATTPLFSKGDNPAKPQSYLLSFYARANYSYLDKYIFTFTGRTDGSSKFGPDNKFGYFPSGAVAWRLSKENFLKSATWLDDLKIRGSYGLTGTQNIGDQMYRTLYSPFSYAGTSALVPTQLGNPAIKWESTKETDAGIDFSLFNNRLQGTVDYYRKQTDGALLSFPIPQSSAFSNLLNNVVNIRNIGYELLLQGDIIRTKNFKWTASVNVTWNKSLVTKLNAGADLSQIGNFTGLEYQNTAIIEGKPLGLITGIKVNGIIKTQKELQDYKAALGGYGDPAGGYAPFAGASLGDPMYALDSSDGYGRYPLFNQLIGNAAPKYFGGFTQEFTYKRFSLSFYFTFSEGGQLMWGDHVSSINFVGTSNANSIMLNRWTPENPNSNQPRLVYQDQALLYNTNLSVFNSSYVKLRTLTFNYSLVNAGWIKRAGVANGSLFASATNVFTITKYPGNNPETSDDPYSVGGGFFDVSNFPPVRTFSIGLKAGF